MDYKLIAFRCPNALLRRVDALAAVTGSSRTQIMVESARIFVKEVKARNNFIVPLLVEGGKPSRAARRKKADA